MLDFGLAKALAPEGSAASNGAMLSPTLTARPTQLGTIIGTAAYMAPEQAKGKAVDRRADIWAFGAVVYEMLTGRRAFDGDDISTTLASVLMREPEWTALPSNTPPAIRALVERCLVKDPRQRLRDMGDARLQIDDTIAGRQTSASSAVVMDARGARGRRRPGWQFASAVAVTAAAAALAAWFAKPSAPAPNLRLSIAMPPGEQVTSSPAITPDGRLIAYAAGRTAASSQLYLRAIDDFAAHPVQGSAGALYPFFSPDTRTIAFFAGGRLRRASVSGGAPVDLASAPLGWGGTWDADGRIVYAPGLNSGLWRVPVEGGVPQQLTKPDGAGAGYAHVFCPATPTRSTRRCCHATAGVSSSAARWLAGSSTSRPARGPASSAACGPGRAVGYRGTERSSSAPIRTGTGTSTPSAPAAVSCARC
ncbi:hypothetical protein BH18ACI5_BH18ACI5_19420 [soil metagenome]